MLAEEQKTINIQTRVPYEIGLAYSDIAEKYGLKPYTFTQFVIAAIARGDIKIIAEVKEGKTVLSR